MVCDDTLRFKNLPKELSTTEKEEFLHHFGATQVKILTSNTKQKSTAYAKFSSKEIAKSVLLRLHQVLVLNSRLCVEFAEHDVTESQIRQKQIENPETNNKKHFKTFINKLNAWNSSVSFYQPPPPHLKYAYPKPNRATINNIAHALASVPKFYTQVLHLMNRMNLPPPFSDVPDPPQMQHRAAPPQPRQIVSQQEQPKSTEGSSESEIESDPETCDKKEIIPKKRTLPQKKSVKRPKFIKPPVTQPHVASKNVEKAEDVFEKVDMQSQKKIEVKVSADSLEQKTNPTEENIGSFGMMVSAEKPATSDVDAQPDSPEKSNNSAVITKEELETNRIPAKDLNILPVFKNYHPGAPTCRLYIKNIAKTVEVAELECIYKRYAEETHEEDKPSQFDIRLMQEGKMKGQAFVTLDSVKLAQKAVKETNGYILKDRPLVVAFARSAVPKK